MFFDMLLSTASLNEPVSLNLSNSQSVVGYRLSITKQGLDSRFNEKSVYFVRSILEELIANQIKEPLDARFLSAFNKVRIKDGTRFGISQRLKEYFPGFGGKNTSNAAICIQYEFDLKSRRLLDLDITSAKRTDYQDAKEKIDQIDKGDLVIRDLGYFSLDGLKSIGQKEAFFLSKLNSKTMILDQNSVELDFSKLYQNMTKNQITRVHLHAFIGEKARLPVRATLELVPEEVYQKRIKDVEKANKKKGCKVSKQYKSKARFNILITNVAEEILPAENMYILYKTRWQVELIFKTWKSTIGIDNLQPMKYHRFMCLLYAKFILFLMNTQMIGLIERKIYDGKRHLSLAKGMKTLLHHVSLILEMLKAPRFRLSGFVDILYELLSENHWLEKRKNNVGFKEIFDILC